jgi:DNA-directed RNA polymerase specialized sigma24 family protein
VVSAAPTDAPMLPATATPDFLDCDTRRRIRRKARQLVGMAGFRQADQEDIEQELTLRVWRSRAGFDPEMGSSAAFVTTVLSRAANSLLRLRNSRKRGPHHSHRSLAVEPRHPAEEMATTACSGASSQQHAIDLAHDVTAVVAQLPAHLRTLAEGLKHESISALARRDNVARSTIYLRLAELRRAFVAADLEILTRASDTSRALREVNR